LANLVRCKRAIENAARGKTAVSGAQVLPKDLDDWRATMEFVLGPLGCEVSTRCPPWIPPGPGSARSTPSAARGLARCWASENGRGATPLGESMQLFEFCDPVLKGHSRFPA
jgi:hypothetical protein